MEKINANGKIQIILVRFLTSIEIFTNQCKARTITADL